MGSRRRIVAFVVVALACVLGASAYVALAVVGAPQAGPGSTAGTAETVVPAAARGSERPPRGVLFRRIRFDKPQLDGRIALHPLHGGRTTTYGLRCGRFYAAGGRGLCVTQDRSGLRLQGLVLDDHLKVRHVVALVGRPSRARVSPDGRYGSVTTFVGGDSYAQPGQFSTRTVILDMAAGRVLADLESLRVTRDDQRIDAPDFNFWGVTFAADSDHFFATLGTGGRTYLIEGSIRARSAHTIHENVECPSLSPDGTRIAYKKLVGPAGAWRLHVLDLPSGRDTAIPDQRPVDDQVEWLDDQRVLYGASQQVWVARADGRGRPSRFIAQAESPSVVR